MATGWPWTGGVESACGRGEVTGQRVWVVNVRGEFAAQGTEPVEARAGCGGMRKGAFLLGGSLKIDRFELLRLAFTQGITPCRTRIMWKIAVKISLSPEGANSSPGGGGTPLVLFASGGLPLVRLSPLLRWKVAVWGVWLGLKVGAKGSALFSAESAPQF